LKRRTLTRPTEPLEGRGIHGGESSRLRILPAEAGSGLHFRRADLNDSPLLGRADLINDASEGGRTTLMRGEARVQTVEHVCSALWGMGLDDALVEIQGVEPPALDGSALPFVAALKAAGIEETDEERPLVRPATALESHAGAASVVCLPVQKGTLLRYLLDYPGEPLAQGYTSFELTPEVFEKEIAPARTFCPAAQVEKFQALGWGRGADTSNTLILEGESVRDNQLRFPDEPLRHKILDMIGDLAFTGGELVAEVRGSRSGHAQNRMLLGSILESCKARNGGQTVLDVNEIRKLLPHRYPFLLVDRILELEPGKRAVGIKNLTVNEHFFQGHFPDVPVMPGVLQIEAMAQVGGILVTKSLPDDAMETKIAVLASLDKVKLRRAVIPGDQMVMEVLLERLRGNFGQCKGRATVDGKAVAEVRVRFALVDASALRNFSRS
jgi:UDP-3-O-[3-hydroxymyristoyl] N-acetylglucosamine deacetylase / 3-hydroxyacyl-[acyl-carrier-protein] dehydratase